MVQIVATVESEVVHVADVGGVVIVVVVVINVRLLIPVD